MNALDSNAPDSPHASESGGWAGAIVSDPISGAAPLGWRVGDVQAPCAPDLALARTARLEARLVVYARYAAIVAEGAAALVAGDEARQVALVEARHDAAEHFAELREVEPIVDPCAAFGDVLSEACHELRFQDGIDRALRRTLGTLCEPVAPHGAPLIIGSGERPGSQLDLRF